MSWKARRYTLDDDDAYRRRQSKKEGSDKLTDHHVPPRHPDPQPRFILRKDERHHRAYHLLFKAAGSFEEAVQILKADWW